MKLHISLLIILILASCLFAQKRKPKAASAPKSEIISTAETSSEARSREELIETTSEELEGFYIVKSLLRDMVDPARIIHRDTQSYMGILLDDNNRKPLARLHFNRAQKYVGIFDEKRSEKRVAIQNINEIYQYAEDLRRVFAFYEAEKPSGSLSDDLMEKSQ